MIFVPLAFVVILNLIPNSSLAAHWSWQPTVKANVRYSDNLRLTRVDSQEAWKYDIAPRFRLSRETANSQVSGDLTYRYQTYTGVSNLEGSDVLLDVSASHSAELSTWVLDAGYWYDSSLTSEVEDTGRIQVRERRKKFNISPSWERVINNISTLRFSAFFASVDFDEGAIDKGLYSYTYGGGDGTYRYFFSPRSVLLGVARVSRYKSSDFGTEFDTLDLQAGFEHEFSERTKGTLLLGGRRTDSTFTGSARGSGGVNNGGSISASLAHNSALSLIRGDVKRQAEPSSAGYIVLRDRVDIMYKRKLGTVISSSLRATAIRSKSLDDNIVGVDRRYYEIMPWVTWRLSRNIDLTAEYRYRYQKYDHQNDSANEQSVGIRISYRGLPRSIH